MSVSTGGKQTVELPVFNWVCVVIVNIQNSLKLLWKETQRPLTGWIPCRVSQRFELLNVVRHLTSVATRKPLTPA